MLRYLTSGESHGPQLTAILSGVPAGVPVLAEAIDRDLKRRQGGHGRGGRMKIETDRVRIVSGVRHGKSLGSPITLVIENSDWRNWETIMSPAPVDEALLGDGPDEKGAAPRGEGKRRVITRPRPGHADLPGVQKFAHDDARNVLERASARATTTQVAVGAVCRQFLAEFGIHLISHVVNLGGIEAKTDGLSFAEIEKRAEASAVRTADTAREAEMIALIDECKREGDTVGGIFEVIATGLPAGLGNVMNWDEKLDGMIGRLFMSMQAVKGVEIGGGFRTAVRRGSEVHDAIYHSDNAADMPPGHGPSGGFYRKTNNAGGLEGGMTNGEPIVVRVAKKPISTLMRPIHSVDLHTREPFDSSKERSDVCALPAAAVIGEALLAYAIAWAFLEKFGGDSLAEVKRNYESYINSLRHSPMPDPIVT